MSAAPPSRQTASEPKGPAGADERILLVRLSHLGDVVHALPVYHALRRAHPSARLAWAVQEEYAELLCHLPGRPALPTFDRAGGLAAWTRLRRQLRALAPTWAIDAQGNWKSALATRLSGAPRRSGLADADWREPTARWLVPDRPAAPAPGPHAVDRMLHLAEHLAPGVGSAGADPRETGAFDLGLPREGDPPPEDAGDRARFEAVLDARTSGRIQLTATDAGRSVVLSLGRPGDPRTWPLDHARELVHRLAEAGRRVLVLSGPAEAEAESGRRLQRDLSERHGETPSVTHWVGQRGLALLAAWFQGGAEAGALYVGPDSGPMHLAWAMGLDVVCLAGPQDPTRTGPWPSPAEGSPHRALTAPGELACRPCLSRRCEHGRGPVCLTELAPAHVAEVVLGR